MRNLLLLAAAGGGAYLMVQTAAKWGSQMALHAVQNPAPVGGLLFAPAAIIGALLGALLCSLVFPRC